MKAENEGGSKTQSLMLTQMNHRKFISREEEVALFQSGKEEDKVKLLDLHLPQILSIASKYAYYEIDPQTYQDIVQEGYLGLHDALDKWDTSRGSFATAAQWYIRRRILKYVNEYTTSIRVPAGTNARRIRTGKKPFEVTVGSMDKATDDFQWIGEGRDRPDDLADWKSVCVLIAEAFLAISDVTKRDVVRQHLVEGKTLKEIGAQYGMATGSVLYRVQEGLKRTRVYMYAHGCKSAAELLESKEKNLIEFERTQAPATEGDD